MSRFQLSNSISFKGLIAGLVVMNLAIIWGVVTANNQAASGPNVAAGLLFLLGGFVTFVSLICFIIELIFSRSK
jgi:hypothetical protein